MADQNIIRNPNAEELRDFTPLMTRKGKTKSKEAIFSDTIAKKEKEAMSKGLPFASIVVREEYKDELDKQAKASVRKNGFLDPKDIKIPKIDWERYSDLKNFELIDEGEKFDEHLSKRQNKQISVKWKKYRFKGFSNTYRVMEEPMKAIERAK